MSEQTLTATGPVDPAEAWERFMQPARWPTWSPQITGVDADAPRLAAGVSGTVRAPLGIGLPFVVDEVDEAARRWTWQVRSGPVHLRLEHWVEAAPGGGTTTGLRVDGPLPLVAAYAPLAKVALEKLVQP
ncbi:SRPBCC family protein [Modestobacter sp. NPDC049651]|uniref:SRPBCC family protein n=1 Tax=unclassified Modestobacter TaxID=2643866 RepID=UPI0033F74594